MELEKLTTEVLKLSDNDKTTLVVSLLESLDTPGVKQLEKQWDTVASLRAREIDSGQVELVTDKEVHAKALKILE